MATAPLSSFREVRRAPASTQRLAERMGWSVIPVDCTVTEIVNGVLHHKKPALVPWHPYMTRRADAQEMAEWRRRFPNAGIAVICGAISNLLVLDADGAAGVAEALKRGLPETPMVRTPSGGMHAYFKAVPGVSFRNGAKMGTSKKLDVRSDRGYVAAPHSVRADGKRYEWMKHPDAVQLAEPPDWFVELLQSSRAEPNPRETLSVKEAPGSGVRLKTIKEDKLDLRSWIRRLPAFAQKLVLDGVDVGERSEADLSVIISLLGINAPPEVVKGIFENYPIGSKFLEEGNGYLERTISAAFQRFVHVRVKYADVREYDTGACGMRVHLALDIEGESRFVRTGLTVPRPGQPELAVRWQHLFNACGVRLPGSTKDEVLLGCRSLVGKRMRVLLSVDRDNPVVGFYAVR